MPGSNRRPSACKADALPAAPMPRTGWVEKKSGSQAASFLTVGPGGLEPPTSSLSGMRSNHLSYGPVPCTLSSAQVITIPRSAHMSNSTRQSVPFGVSHPYCVETRPKRTMHCAYPRYDIGDPYHAIVAAWSGSVSQSARRPLEATVPPEGDNDDGPAGASRKRPFRPESTG